MKKLRVIVGCEYSQIVMTAFLEKGHDAYSCDIIPAEGDYPERHFQEDILEVLKRENFDLGIFFPPCTHLAVSGARWFKEKRKDGRQQQGIDFFMNLINTPIDKIAVENPVGIMSTVYRKPDQIIQPWQFGHGETKATCLWLKNLPLLKPENIVSGREQRIWKMTPGPDRAKERSRTFQGIANALANQYG